MLDPGSNRELPPIPAKRYFTIGEVSELCDVKPVSYTHLDVYKRQAMTTKPKKRPAVSFFWALISRIDP